MALDTDLKENMMNQTKDGISQGTVPTKRQLDNLNMMLDESLGPKANWEDPEEVLEWIQTSEEEGILTDPVYDSIIYKDGKSGIQVMTEMLRAHGYGESKENQDETVQKINQYIWNLEKRNPSPSYETSILNESASSMEEGKSIWDIDLDKLLGELSDQNPSMQSQSVPISEAAKKAPEKDEENLNTSKTTMESSNVLPEDEIRELLAEAEKKKNNDENQDTFASTMYSESEDPYSATAWAPIEKEDKTEQVDSSSNEVKIKKEETEEKSQMPMFFTTQPKEDEIEKIAQQSEAKVDEKDDILPLHTMEQEMSSTPSFFTKQEKADEIEQEETTQDKTQRMESISRQFNVPSSNVQENLAAINWAITTKKPEDIERAEQALAALPPHDQTTAYFRNQIEALKAELQQTEQQMDNSDLSAFQAKYGPTANEKEMEIVNRLENEMTSLQNRREEILTRLNEIQDTIRAEQKESTSERKVQTERAIDRSKIEAALQEIHEKEKNSPRLYRNNEAMPDFYKAVETHQIMDIVRASHAVERLGNNHLFYGSLNSALDEIANTYYGKTIEGLKSELKETHKDFSEALNLLSLDAQNGVLAGRIGPLKEAFNQITTDRSKERMLTAIDEIQKLGADHPYAKRLTKALNGMSNIYYGKTAEELQRQVVECNKATEEVHQKLEKDRKRINALYDDNTKGKVYDTIEAVYNRAVLDPTKENIMATANIVSGLHPEQESTIALNNALTILTATYLDTSLNELKRKDLEQSIENIQQTFDQIPDSMPIEDALAKAEVAFRNAVRSKEKGDIVVALNITKEIKENQEIRQNIVDTLDKLSLVYHGVHGTELMEQFKKYSGALNIVNDLVSPNSKKLPEDAKQNDAMPYFYKAIQTRDLADIQLALDEVNKLPDYHPLKKPLKDALDAEMKLVGKVPNTYILEEEEPRLEPEKEENKELREEATNLINECNEIDSKIDKYQHSLDQYGENKKKEAEDLRKKEEEKRKLEEEERKKREAEQEPPARVIEDTTNKNPNIFKKALAGAKEALSNIKITKKGVATVAFDAVLIGASVLTGQGAIVVTGILAYQLGNLRKKKKDKKEKAKKEKVESDEAMEIEDSIEEENEMENAPEPMDMTSAIIESGMEAIKQRDLEQKQGIQYYELNGNTWDGLGDATEAKKDVINAIAEGRTVGYTINEDANTMPSEIPADYLAAFISEHNELPSAEEMNQVILDSLELENVNKPEENGRGK